MIRLNVPIIAAILFALGSTLMVMSGIVAYKMIGEINRKLPEDQQVRYLWFYPSKTFRITREYRRLYPQGRLNWVRIILTIIGGALIIASAEQASRLLR